MKLLRFRNIKLQTKLLISFFVLILLPLFSIGVYSYQVASRSMLDNASVHGLSSANRLNEHLNQWIGEAAMVSSYPIGNTELQQPLEKNYDNYTYPFYEKMQDVKTYQHFINQLMNIHLDLDYFFFYPFNQENAILQSNRGVLFPSQTVFSNKAWYQAAIRADGYWVFTGLHQEGMISDTARTITVSRLIKDLSDQRPLAVVSIMIDQSSLEKLLNEAEREGEFSFLLYDGNGNILAKSEGVPKILQPGSVVHDNTLISIGTKKYVQVVNQSPQTGWSLVAVAAQAALLDKLMPIKRGFVITISLTLIVAVIVSILMSRNLVRPLKHLKRSMSKVQQGIWNPVVMEERSDEVGELSRNYNRMIEQLKLDVELLIEKERQKKDLEFKSLQAQINPHFIYNTLNAINWMSNMGNTAAINEMIEALVFILRSTSNRKGNFISVQDEWEFLERYLTIMRVRYNDQFRIHWEFAPEILDAEIPRMILQPVIENAIVHGLEKETGMGEIHIRGYRQLNGLCLEVEDNGAGFDERAEAEPKETKFSSIGLENVKERLSILYGGESRLEIVTGSQEGTMVRFHIPIS